MSSERRGGAGVAGLLPVWIGGVHHWGTFVALAEPVVTGKIGRGYAAGVCPAKIDVPDEKTEYRFADITDGVADNLKANHYGSAAKAAPVCNGPWYAWAS